jgi:hypothetical protein
MYPCAATAQLSVLNSAIVQATISPVGIVLKRVAYSRVIDRVRLQMSSSQLYGKSGGVTLRDAFAH